MTDRDQVYRQSASLSSSLAPSLPLRSSLKSLSKCSPNTIFSTATSHSKQFPSIPVKEVVSDTSFLTREILALGDAAMKVYDAVRLTPPEGSTDSHVQPLTLLAYDDIHRRHLVEDFQGFQESQFMQQTHPTNDVIDLQTLPEVLPEEPSNSGIKKKRSLSSFTRKQLEQYYSAAIDARNALHLRQSMVAVDIGDLLELLLPKMSLYEKDKATIDAAEAEIELIQQECSKRNLKLNFHALEFMRIILPPYKPSFMEKHSGLFASSERILDQKHGAYMAAVTFLEDPLALNERRLPRFGTSQR